MNQISPLLKLHPKLYMLIHSGQHLVTLAQSMIKQSDQTYTYTTPSPIQWHLILPQNQNLQQTHVSTCQALNLPAFAGLPAAIHGQTIEDVQPNTLYQFPDLIFELLDPDTKPAREIEISCGQYQSSIHSNPARDLLEYGASLLHYDLAEWGFRCLRKKNQLVFEGHGFLAGWNLRIKSVEFPRTDLTLCHLGLYAGLSSLLPGQQKGRYSDFYWGPWEINQYICQITLPFYDPEEFTNHFCQELNQELSPIGIAAFWDPENYLILSHQQAGQTIEIKRLEPINIKGIDRYLELDLPEGVFGRSEQANWSGSFDLNRHKIVLQQSPVDFVSAKAHLLQMINSNSNMTGVQVELNADDYLIFKSLTQQDNLVIEAISESAQRALGLQHICLDHSVFEEFATTCQRWVTMLNQFLLELPMEIEQALMLHKALEQLPEEIAVFNENQVTWIPFTTQQAYQALIQFLNFFLPCLEKSLEISSQQFKHRLKPLQLELELSQTPNSQVPGHSEPLESSNLSSFDHKI